MLELGCSGLLREAVSMAPGELAVPDVSTCEGRSFEGNEAEVLLIAWTVLQCAVDLCQSLEVQIGETYHSERQRPSLIGKTNPALLYRGRSR